MISILAPGGGAVHLTRQKCARNGANGAADRSRGGCRPLSPRGVNATRFHPYRIVSKMLISSRIRVRPSARIWGGAI